MSRPERFPNLTRIASRAFVYQIAVALAVVLLFVMSDNTLHDLEDAVFLAGLAMFFGAIGGGIAVAWEEKILSAPWAELRGRRVDRFLVWPLLTVPLFVLLNAMFLLSDISWAVGVADPAIEAIFGSDVPEPVAAIGVALAFIAGQAITFAVCLAIMALPALAVHWTRLCIEGRDPFWTRRRTGVAVMVVLLVAAPTVAGVVGGFVGGPPDEGGFADEPSPGDFRANMALGSYQSATAAHGCTDEEFDTKGRSLTEHNVSSVTHESEYIEIAPYYWDTNSRDDRVDGWFHVRLTNGSAFVVNRATVVGQGAYQSSNEWKAGLSLWGHEDRLKLGGSDIVYVYFDVIDENGEVERHTTTLCPSEQE